MPAEPYSDTSVPVARSQAAIERILTDSGALGVRFNLGRFTRLQQEETDAPEPQTVEFIWPVEGGEQVVRLTVTPKSAERSRDRYNRARGTWRVSPEQRLRQAWRGLYWYLEGTLKAATFGLIRFEDVFLSFIVTGDAADSPTVGELMIEHLQAGGRAAALLEAGDVIEGEVVG